MYCIWCLVDAPLLCRKCRLMTKSWLAMGAYQVTSTPNDDDVDGEQYITWQWWLYIHIIMNFKQPNKVYRQKSILTKPAVKVGKNITCFFFSFHLFLVSVIISDIRKDSQLVWCGIFCWSTCCSSSFFTESKTCLLVLTRFQDCHFLQLPNIIGHLLVVTDSTFWASRSPYLKSCPFLASRHNAMTLIPNLVHLCCPLSTPLTILNWPDSGAQWTLDSVWYQLDVFSSHFQFLEGTRCAFTRHVS